MAQVRKFQDGGKTFTLGGYTFNTDNAEDIKMLEEMASDSTYGGIAQSVLDNVRNGSYANTLKMYRTADGRVVMEGGLQNVTDQHLSSGTQKALQRKDTYINNLFKRQSAKDWANNTDAFLNEITRRKNSKKDVSDSDNKKRITGVSDIADGQWVYTPDNKWSTDSPDNARMLKQLKYLEEYFNASEDDRKKYYDVSALDPDELEGWLAWRKDNAAFNPDLFKKGALRISDNDPFYSQYRWFGFTPGTKSQMEARESEANLATIKKELKNKGFDWEGAENDFIIDASGDLVATPGLLQKMGLSGSIGYWFNDDWNKVYTDSGATNPYAQLLGSAIVNGKLYKDVENNAALHNWLKNTQYDEEMAAWNAENANKIFRTYYTGNPYFQLVDDSKIYNPWTWRNNRNFRSIQTKKANEGQSLIEYWTPIENDPLFRQERKYAWLNNNTGAIKELSSEQAKQLALLDEYGNFQDAKFQDYGHKLINGVYESQLFKNNDNIRVFHDPVTDDYYINKYGEGNVYKIPNFKEIEDKLKASPKTLSPIWKYVSGKSKDISLLKALVGEDWINKLSPIFNDSSHFVAPISYFTDEGQAQYKNGGVLKFTDGGRYKSIDTFRFKKYTPTQPKKDDKKKDDNKPMTNADWWEVGSLAADTIAAITTIIDPTNIGGAVVGLGATGAGLVSDIKKDGLDWGDAGRFGLNLLMDFGTLIPILGDGIAASRLVKAATKITPWIARIARLGSIKGITEGTVVLFDKIASGNFKDLTKDDWRAALNLLNGLTSLKRTGMSNMPTKKVTQDFSDIKSRKGNTSVKLESAAIDNIKKADVDTRLLKAQEEILAAHNKKYPKKQITLEEVSEHYNIPTEKTSRHWYTPWNRRVVPDLNKQSTETVPLTWSEVNRLNKNENKSNFGKWWSGTGDTQQMYQRQMYGERPGSKTIEKVELKPMFPKGMEKQHPFGHPLHVPAERGVLVPMEEVRSTTTIPGKIHFIQGYNVNPDYLSNWWNQYHVEPEPEPIQYLSPEEFFGYYKKGGVLKGQDGLNSSQTFRPKFGSPGWKPLSKPTGFNASILDPNYSITTSAAQRAGDKAITGTFSNGQTITDAFGNELQLDANKGFVKQDSVTTETTGTDGKVTDPLSARVDSSTNDYLRKAERSRNRNRLAQLFAAGLQRRMGDQFADKVRNNLLMNQVVSPNLSWNQRWIDPRGNQAERLGASLLTSTNQFNTADSGLNRAAKLDMLGKIGQLGMNNIDQQANAFNTQLDATNQRNMQQRIMDAQTRTQNNQIASNAYMASDQQRYGANNAWLTTTANIFDKIEAEDTTKWNKLGQTKANLEMQAAKYDELAASATDEKTKSAYQAMAGKLRDPKTLELYLNSGGYSTQSVKKGAKLRPMHEQMLIDKQKLVARAIEKINDNTMKILLKAMS